ncbi:hypothetical protein LguiA_033735 [Lonicera macranthoides]
MVFPFLKILIPDISSPSKGMETITTFCSSSIAFPNPSSVDGSTKGRKVYFRLFVKTKLLGLPVE